MYTYNPASTIADEFINHEEILETLAYADENKNNEALIDSILEKAKLRKGLTHREASVLLACQSEPKKNGNPSRNAKQQTKRDGRRKSDIGYTGYPCYNIVNHKAAGYPDQYSCHQSNDFRLKDRDYSDNKPDQIT